MTVKTVKSAYGNHREEIYDYFLSKGFTLDKESRVGDMVYITFKFDGDYVSELRLNLPNAHIL